MAILACHAIASKSAAARDQVHLDIAQVEAPIQQTGVTKEVPREEKEKGPLACETAPPVVKS